MSKVLISAKPFLKWAGGKTQLLEYIEKNLPEAVRLRRIKAYVEPFVGSGAVFFYLISKYNFDDISISDANSELINTYNVIKNNVEGLISKLEVLDLKYRSANEMSRKEMFYEIRTSFNVDKVDNIMHAAYFIFLNRTCFNGLYRVNSSGHYNVPHGKYKNPKICDAENLMRVSACLQNVRILNDDFSDTYKYIDNDTFVYFDPPYRPLNVTSNFNAYAKTSFNDDSQRRLAEYTNKLHKLGAKFMLSNSDPKNNDEEDLFFDELYKNYNIQRVHARRMINSDASKRGIITELLITNY